MFNIEATVTIPALVDRSFSRSYVAQLDDNSLQQLSSLAEQDLVTPNTLQGIGGFYAHDINSVKQREIVGGHNKRNVIYLNVKRQVNAQKFNNTYIVAYTEGIITTPAGTIDPLATWYINSVTEVDTILDPTTNQWISSVLDSFSILGGSSAPLTPGGMMGINHGQELMARPQDIVNALRPGRENTTSNIYNATPKTSNFANRTPTEVVAKLITTYQEAKSVAGMSYDNDNVLKTAAGALAETYVTQVSFLSRLSSITGEHIPNTFTLANLAVIVPNIKPTIVSLAQPKRSVGAIQTDFIGTENVATLGQRGEAEAKATTMIDNLVGLVGTNLHTSVTLLVTNFLSNDVRSMLNTNNAKTYNGGNTYVVTLGASCLVGGQLSIQKLNDIINAFVNNTWLAVTANNRRTVKALIHVNIMGGSRISLSLDGGQDVVYNVDSYTDSNTASVITNQANFNNLTQATDTILNVIDGSQITNQGLVYQ